MFSAGFLASVLVMVSFFSNALSNDISGNDLYEDFKEVKNMSPDGDVSDNTLLMASRYLYYVVGVVSTYRYS